MKRCAEIQAHALIVKWTPPAFHAETREIRNFLKAGAVDG
jgi:hypothetical protein